MHTKNWIFSLLFAALLVTSFVLLNSSAPVKKTPVKVEDAVCCKELPAGNQVGKCTPETKPQNAAGEMIIDNLSRQFISISPLAN